MASRKPNTKPDKQKTSTVDIARRKLEEACVEYIRALEAGGDCGSDLESPRTVARADREADSMGLVVTVFRKRPPLTEREKQVGRLVGQGLGNKGIARELDVGAKTVEKHVERIKLKWGITTRAELSRHAILELC